MYIIFVIIAFPAIVMAIRGGASVDSSSTYPFSVRLTEPILCGGSIISLNPPWILTAAHCIENLQINQNRYTVAYGNKNATRQSYAAIRQAIVHPLYVSSQRQQAQVYATAYTDGIPYDIGLIRLTSSLVANKFVNRIPLLVNQTTSMDMLETIGMGYTGYEKPQAEILQFAQCNSSNAETLRDNNYNNSIILATSNAGLCHGDSGSPLLVKSSANIDAEYYLGGILNRILNAYDPDPENGSCPLHESNLTSFIDSFVKPSAHLKWIMSVTKLSLDDLIDPMTSADGFRMFAAPTSSATTDAPLLLRGAFFGIDWSLLLLMASLFALINL
ncbi:trypsin-like cysteine/serine peptidase domain-containing protein [Parasitella parasitica]|nr:trypsin-like cysteine/serine peptidase domain-containing protein [Parasitella parasitica]